MLTFHSRHELETIDITNNHGLTFSFFPGGQLFRATCDNILINQILGSPVESSLNNIYLHLKSRHSMTFVPLVGPAAPSRFTTGRRQAVWQGQWEGLAYTCALTLHPEGALWFWTVDLHNLGTMEHVCDVIYAQDIGLAPEGTVRLNEAYCSQYIDHHVFSHAQYGFVVCSRQNQACDGRHPWLMQGGTERVQGYVTDGFSFYGLSYKEDNIPYALTQEGLPNEKKQYEMAFCGLQSDDFRMAPGERRTLTFYAAYLPHHPQPTNDTDSTRIDETVMRVLQEQGREQDVLRTEQEMVKTIFDDVTMLTGDDLTEEDLRKIFPGERRHEEYRDGNLWSFFYGDATHVVLKAKERHVERPHGHIMRSGSALFPQEDTMSSTAYMYGVFHSQMTIGNTAFNKLLSITRTPLNILKSSGQRIWVKRGETYQLLGMPSCFEVGLQACRWFYKTAQGWTIITAWMSAQECAAFLSIESEQPQEFVILSHVVLGNNELDQRGHVDIDAQSATITLTPHPDTEVKKLYPEAVFYVTTSEKEKVKGIDADAWLFADEQSRALPYLTIHTESVHTFSLVFTGSVLHAKEAEQRCQTYQSQAVAWGQDQQAGWAFWQETARRFHVACNADNPLAAKLNDLFYWYLHNAMVHYTIPHGLEQYTGAAWGVRDVCQGPVEMLFATRHYAAIKAILLKVFAQQYEDTADWPQWFMFDRFVRMQHPESHGDIIVWPLKALALYLEATNDVSIFDAEVPYTEKNGFAFTPHQATLFQHVQRTIDAIEARFIPGTVLSCYGSGDWDDTLQPADAAMRQHMVSAWTVALTYQVFQQLATALQRAGYAHEQARLHHLAQRIKEDFNRYLMKERVVSGFGYFHPGGEVEHLLHPTDMRTGMHYRLLPMIRGMISELFAPEQVQDHVRLIDEHLTFPDGVRLMNKPVSYQGGVRVFFRRAEEAANFGREIGLQYVHAHIRYLEAMCKIGQATKAYAAILQIVPINIQEDVPNAKTRQSNAYFSSSDADVKDRYEAEQVFEEMRAGNVPVKGGWRIYSSGPGILLNQVITSFLGIRDYYEYRVIDPVLPKMLNGLRFTWVEEGIPVTYVFSIAHDEPAAVQSLTINGQEVAFVRQDNPYRHGGAMIQRGAFHALLNHQENIVGVNIAQDC